MCQRILEEISIINNSQEGLYLFSNKTIFAKRYIMNYILRQINRKIQFLKSTNRQIELKPHYQAKLEFYLNVILGYLWNKNWEKFQMITGNIF